MRKILFIALLLTVSITLTARQKPAGQEKQQPREQEQAMVQRLYETRRSVAAIQTSTKLMRHLWSIWRGAGTGKNTIVRG